MELERGARTDLHSGADGRLRGIAGRPPALSRGQHRYGYSHAHFRPATCGPADPTAGRSPARLAFFRTALRRIRFPAPRSIPNFGRINATLWQANSFYDAMQVDVAKRVSHGIQFHAAYTWGKSIDTLSATEADDAFPNGLFNQIFFDQRTTRGLSDFNVAQTLVLSATWEIPGPPKGSRLPEWAFGGWQLVGSVQSQHRAALHANLGRRPGGHQLDETGEVPSIRSRLQCWSTKFQEGCQRAHLPQCQLLHSAAMPTPPPSPPNASPSAGGPEAPASPGPARISAAISAAISSSGRGSRSWTSPCLRITTSGGFRKASTRSFARRFSIFSIAPIFPRRPITSLSSIKTAQPIQSGGLIDSTQTTSRQIQFALKLIW